MKQMTLIEMDWFLKGKCTPRDLKVNETNAEYLVRKFGDLESKLETALRECRSAGITIDNLEARCAALLDERGKNQQYIKLRDQENEDIALTVGKLRVELEAAKSKLNEQREYYEGVISDGCKRIAELEAREILLPERSSMLHRTDFNEDYQTVMAYKVSEVIAAIRAAGIRIKGE